MGPVKIVVRFTDGRTKKGYSQDFFSNKPLFHLIRNQPGGSQELEEIRMADLKAVFFVHTFAGNPDYNERKTFAEDDNPKGRKVEVTFSDGESLQGSVLGYRSEEAGFFLFPADPKSNNMKVFVVNASVKEFRYLGAGTAQSGKQNDYQCLIPESRGKLLMISGEERKVLRLVLSKVLETESVRGFVIEKLGDHYLNIAEQLLKDMEMERI
jgi:hypothetical protein